MEQKKTVTLYHPLLGAKEHSIEHAEKLFKRNPNTGWKREKEAVALESNQIHTATSPPISNHRDVIVSDGVGPDGTDPVKSIDPNANSDSGDTKGDRKPVKEAGDPSGDIPGGTA